MLSTTSQPDMSKSKIVIVEPGWVKKLLKVDIGDFVCFKASFWTSWFPEIATLTAKDGLFDARPPIA